jgi:cytochrome c peroxidase
VFLQPFTLGANDILSPSFTRKVFDIYDAWAVYDQDNGHGDCRDDRGRGAARAAIYRGQEIFNNHEFDITGVPGFNDVMGQDAVRGTCSTCHNAPNIGGHAVIRMIDLGTANEHNCAPELPILTLQNKVTLETRKVCDMGFGGNGVWANVAKFRVPPLRGLAARAPYFHDGQARTIAAVIRYYEKRFDMDLSRRQRDDLEAFLGAL